MGVNLNDGIIEEIRLRNDIISVVSQYVDLKKSGYNYKGLCPFHHEKTPSFMVSEEKQLYHCFGCGEAGNVINFVMKIENLDFIDAATVLGEKVGIHFEEFSTSKQEKEELSRKNKIYEINREAAIFYYKNLFRKNNAGTDYLKKRGLQEEIIKKFGLGYAEDQWESLNKYLLNKGYDQKLIYQAGLVLERKNENGYYDRFRNRVIFPIIDTTARVIGFGGRAIDDSMPKYLNSPETSVFNKGYNLFGLNLAKKEIGKDKSIIIVEGYMDVISLYQHGIKNVVATLGTALTKNQGNLLKRYANEIFIAYDSDAAGQAATLKGLEILGELECKVKVIRLSEGKDPDELIKKKGKEHFLEEITKALSLIDYKILLSKQRHGIESVEGRIEFVKTVARILKQVKSPVEVDAYIKKIALETQISEEAIKREIYGNNVYNQQNFNPNMIGKRDKYRSSTERYTNKYSIQSMRPSEKSGYLEAERALLKLVIEDKAIFQKVKNNIHPENFIDTIDKKIIQLIFESYETKEVIDIQMISEQLDMDELLVLNEIQQIILPQENLEKALVDYINTIEKYKLIEEEINIKKALKEVENNPQGEIARIRELCIKLEKVQRELKRL